MTTPVAPRSKTLVHHLLDTPDLVEAVRTLPAPALGALVAQIGMEDAGELVALATTEQLTHLFDESVFGEDERIDPARFALVLEVMLESGDAFTADRVVELPEDLVRAAVHDFALVLDLDVIAVHIAEGGQELAAAGDYLEAARTEDLLSYLLVVRRQDGWDAVWATLLALAERHSDYLERLLSRLALAAMDRIADEGLYEVLGADEMLVEDAAAEREERRAKRGFVSASDARAFLALARDPKADLDTRDAVTSAWFRRLTPLAEPAAGPAVSLEAVLARAGVAVLPPSVQPTAARSDDPSARLRAAMDALARTDPAVHDTRLEELAFLANVLSAAAPPGDRHRRAIEAVADAIATCGAALVRRSGDAAGDVEVLRARSLDLLFREGVRVTG